MGGIFLRRRSKARAEFINDAGRDVTNLFRVLQEHYVAFLDLLRFQLTTQANFHRLIETDPETLTDLQRAARFLHLQRTAKTPTRHSGLAGVLNILNSLFCRPDGIRHVAEVGECREVSVALR